MKAILIKWLLPLVLELAIAALKSLAQRSDNDIDDHLVAEIAKNEQKIMDEIKKSL